MRARIMRSIVLSCFLAGLAASGAWALPASLTLTSNIVINTAPDGIHAADGRGHLNPPPHVILVAGFDNAPVGVGGVGCRGSVIEGPWGV